MEDIIAEQLTALTKENDETQETNKEKMAVSTGLRYKVILLVCGVVLLLINMMKEILTSELIMENVFYLINNYINSTREMQCNVKDAP